MTEEERQAALENIINKQLGKSGVPRVGVNSAGLSPQTNGQLDFQNWQLDINSSLLSSNTLSAGQASSLANTVYHEARHAEQWFAMARSQAATGLTGPQLATGMQVPASVASSAAAAPLAANSSPQAVFGQAMNQSVYGSQGSYRNNVLNTLNSNPSNQVAYQQYRGLPEEQDAWSTGDATVSGGC